MRGLDIRIRLLPHFLLFTLQSLTLALRQVGRIYAQKSIGSVVLRIPSRRLRAVARLQDSRAPADKGWKTGSLGSGAYRRERKAQSRGDLASRESGQGSDPESKGGRRTELAGLAARRYADPISTCRRGLV